MSGFCNIFIKKGQLCSTTSSVFNNESFYCSTYQLGKNVSHPEAQKQTNEAKLAYFWENNFISSNNDCSGIKIQ